GRAPRCGPGRRRRAWGCVRRRSAPRPRWCDAGRATWAGGDQGRAVTGKASDAGEARGFDGFSQGHGWQNGDDSQGQHRHTRPGGPLNGVWVTRPALDFASLQYLGMPQDIAATLLLKLNTGG